MTPEQTKRFKYWQTRTIVAPMIGWPSVSATRPLMLDVVTCAEAVQNANSDKNKKASFLISISLD